MNILQIIDETWDSGITNYALSLSVGLNARGHNIIIACSEGNFTYQQALKAGLDRSVLGKVFDIQSIRKIILKRNIEIVNAHTGTGHSLAVIAAGLSKKKVAVVRTRGDIRKPKNNLLLRYLYERTDAFITPAEFIRLMYINNCCLAPEKIFTVYQGIDAEKYYSGKQWSSDRAIRIGIVGRLDPVKGHRYFIEAMAIVKKHIPDIQCMVIGQEKNISKQQLLQLSKKFGISNELVMTGYHEDIPRVMSSCDIGIIASTGSEAVSRVLLEWMASSCPVVGTNVGCIGEIIREGESGFVVHPGDPKAIADKVIYLIENHNIREKMGYNARRYVQEKYSIEAFLNQTLDVYNRVV